jgi:hypothetical protein
MNTICKVCGCELSCPICEDANASLVDDIDALQQKCDRLQADRYVDRGTSEARQAETRPMRGVNDEYSR